MSESAGKWYEGMCFAELLPSMKGKLVFDIGAACGNMTKLFASFGANVVAVEPQKWETEKHAKAFASAIAVENVAVADRSGTLTFYECKTAPHISTCSFDWTNGLYRVKKSKRDSYWIEKQIACVTLDDLIAKYGVPYFVKVDVEGFEDRVWGGLSTKIDYVSFEYTSGFGRVFRRSLGHLEKLGYANFSTFHKFKIDPTNKRSKKAYARRDWSSVDELMQFFKDLNRYEQGDLLAS